MIIIIIMDARSASVHVIYTTLFHQSGSNRQRIEKLN